jgi:hypothetical protein
MIYNSSDILTNSNGVKYYKSKRFPNIPPTESDIYIVTTSGDRLDLLSYTYYKDPSFWWVISGVNNNVTRGSLFPEPGTQLRIPVDLNKILITFNNENQ